MMRLTNTDKWKDTFFYNITPAPKLVFIYLYENCNEAGFIDLNYETMQDLLKLDKQKIGMCLKALESKFVVNKDRSKIWLKNFLLHQNKLPLATKSEEGSRIKTILENNLASFNYDQSITEILTNSVNKRISERIVFVKPSLDEVIVKFSIGKYSNVSKSEIENIYLHYQSCGWKIGRSKKPMVDWVSSFEGCFRRNKKGIKLTDNNEIPIKNGKPTRLDKITEANEELGEIDFHSLRKH